MFLFRAIYICPPQDQVVRTCFGKTILFEYGHEEETGDSSYLENDMIATSTPKYHDSRLDTCYAGIISTVFNLFILAKTVELFPRVQISSI